MDSLLANYASSDEEEEQHQQHTAFPSKFSEPFSSSSSKASSLFSSLPGPKSSSLFSSLPQPKQSSQNPSSSIPKIPIDDINEKYEEKGSKPTSKSSSIFSSLPQPKPQDPQQPISKTSSLDPNTKRVVQFKPPINLSSIESSDFDEEDEKDDQAKYRKKRKESESFAQTSSVKSFLSSIPAPKSSATLGVLLTSGSGRRSIIETQVPMLENQSGNDQNVENFVSHELGIDQTAGNYLNYDSYGNYQSSYNQNVSGDDASSYGTYENYGNYGDYEQYGNNWGGDGPVIMAPETTGMAESGVIVRGKRGRNEVPAEIVEVKQDELIKNRPREDQAKLTGIAFGPSYQPTSTKGKPTKLHKRKHQIGSLYYDMRQKEMELTERRAKGFLTKAETQAKYGW